jgi:hypothetical protein
MASIKVETNGITDEAIQRASAKGYAAPVFKLFDQ